MPDISENNKRIAKNTLSLYCRNFIVLIASLYTSRLVLRALGAIDLGIYNVVGGIVTLIAFFQSAQSKTTSRFITYELGKGKAGNPTKIFSACMTIHICIALIVLILGETIGLWIINHWVDIPHERLIAAQWVYQFALITFCFQLIRIPYDAIVISHENMSVYAYMSIFEVFFKLLSVTILMKINFDKLIAYAGLVLLITIILFILYSWYVKRRYPIFIFRWLWDKDNSLKILSFSGWTLLGSSTNTATQQGVSILLNNFVGLTANAALGFANQVNAAVVHFVSSFTTAFNPQIIKYHAQKNYSSLHILIFRASKFSFVLCYLLVLPIIANTEFILNIWLVDVPQYTVEFCQMILISSIIDATTGVYNTAITASGHIKKYQIYISFSFIIDLIIASVILRIGLHPAFVFVSRIFTRGFLNMVIGLKQCKRLLCFRIKIYMKEVLSPIVLTIIISITGILLFKNMEQSWLRLLFTLCVSTTCIMLCTLFLICTKNEAHAIINFTKSKILRNN